MTEAASLERLFGIALMFFGSVVAAAAYLVPVVLRARPVGDVAAPEDELVT